MHSRFVTAFVLPTGIGASIGGFLGDATPLANRMAALSDWTITNPNSVNGGVLNLMAPNIVYTEGTMLDKFFRGETGLRHSINRIGIVVEKTGDRGARALIENTANALKAVGGIEIVGIEWTSRKVGARAEVKHGVAHGHVDNLSALDEPVRKLIRKGATAIAISTEPRCDKKLWDLYFRARGPNPVGALEAVISHHVVTEYRLPAAHAPLVEGKDWTINLRDEVVYWRAGAEAISPAYLGSVLWGLSRAPQFSKKGLRVKDIAAVVVPHSACGGIPVFECAKRDIPVITIREIKTNLNVTPERIGLKTIETETVEEAMGILERMRKARNLGRQPF